MLRMRKPLSTLAGIGGIAAAVGLVLVLCTGLSWLGLGLLVFGIPLGLGTFVTGTWDVPRSPIRAVLLTIAFAALTVGLAGAAGLLARFLNPADYYGRYGSSVTASLPEECWNRVRHRSPGAADWMCRGSTWRVDGVEHTGTIVLGRNDVYTPQGTVDPPETVEARVLGDKGYSVARTGTIDRVVVWGRVPIWCLAGLPLFLAALLRLAFLHPGTPSPRAAPAVPT
jgi:hypothetical protein